jgi:hypothetical protein
MFPRVASLSLVRRLILLMNALSKYDNRSPRERFWSSPQTWPDDTADYEFVGRLILRRGAAMSGAEWNDLDPAAVIPMQLSEHVSIHTPAAELRQASDVLIMSKLLPGQLGLHGLLAPPYPEIPSRADWAIAREIVVGQIDIAQARHRRFLRACFALEQVFKSGKVKTATRHYAGGELTPQPWHFWNMEYVWTRFETCRVNPSNHFDYIPCEAGGLWIFVERNNVISSISEFDDGVLEPSDNKIDEIVRDKPRVRGRKSKSPWDTLMSALVRIVHDEGVPEAANISELARRLADWGSEQGLDEIPAPKTIEPKLRLWLAELQTARQ